MWFLVAGWRRFVVIGWCGDGLSIGEVFCVNALLLCLLLVVAVNVMRIIFTGEGHPRAWWSARTA